jgi:hypothetical protein
METAVLAQNSSYYDKMYRILVVKTLSKDAVGDGPRVDAVFVRAVAFNDVW